MTVTAGPTLTDLLREDLLRAGLSHARARAHQRLRDDAGSREAVTRARSRIDALLDTYLDVVRPPAGT